MDFFIYILHILGSNINNRNVAVPTLIDIKTLLKAFS